MDRKVFAEKLGVRDNTIIFVLLTIVTLGFYVYYWGLKFVETVVGEQERKKYVTLVLVTVGLCTFNSLLPSCDIHVDEDIEVFSGLLSLVSYVLSVIYAIMLKKPAQEYFKAQGHEVRFETIWCILFNFFYYYYKTNQVRLGVNNARANQTFDEQLKALHELKAQGVITEEEFAAKKAQILGNLK